MEKTIRHRFPISAADFWEKVFFDDEYNEGLYREAFDNESVEFLEQNGDLATGISRRVRTVPRMDMPGPVRKVLGNSFSFIEEGQFDAATKRCRFQMIPSTLADKIQVQGEIWLEEISPEEIERVCTVEFNVKIFGVGSMIEKLIASSLMDQYEKAAQHTLKFIENKG